MNERRDDLSTADLAGQQPAGTAPAAREDDPAAYRDPLRRADWFELHAGEQRRVAQKIHNAEGGNST